MDNLMVDSKVYLMVNCYFSG